MYMYDMMYDDIHCFKSLVQAFFFPSPKKTVLISIVYQSQINCFVVAGWCDVIVYTVVVVVFKSHEIVL